MQDMTNDIYREWKIDQGFTPKEVILKSKSLKRCTRSQFLNGLTYKC